MATPNPLDIQAVKDAMAKTPWLNYVDAARQVRWVQNPVAPITAPVAPLVPTPTVTPAPVSPTVNVQEQMAGKTVAERQAIRSWTPTAVAPTAPVAPNTPAPVQNVSDSAPVKQDATPWITQDAFQQAQAKSAEIKAQNDAVMAQNKQKSDLAREDAALAAQAAIPTDKKGIVNAMVTGASVPVQKTEAYNKAVVTSDLFKQFSWMTSDQLFQNLQQGQIGTELSGLLASNPNFAIAKQKYDQLQKTNSINAQARAAYNAANWETTPVVDDLAKIEAKYTAPVGTNAQAYEQFVTQDPDVKKSWLEVKTLTTQINELTKTYNDTLHSLKISNPTLDNGSLALLLRINTKETKDLLDSYISAKELAKGDLDLAMKMATGHYQATSKDIAEQQQEAQQIAQEKRQMQNTLALWQAQFDQKIAQQAQAMNDPTMAISTMIDEYKKLGIPVTRSTQQVISDFQSSGQDLPTYLSGLQKLIQSKPEYKRYQQLQQWQLTDSEKLALQNKYDLAKIWINNQQDIQKLALQYNLKNSSDIQSAKIDLMSKWATSDQADSIIRNATGNWKWASGQSLLSAVDWTVIPTRLSETTNPNGGKECAEYVNDVTWLGLGSTWDSKKAKIDSSITTPKAWDTAIWIPDPSNKQFAQYGHAGIVTGSDGTNVTIKSSNLQGNWAINTITVPISQITKTGGFANTAIKWSTTTKPLSDQQYTQYNQATSKFVADPNVKAFESALAQGGDLIASLKSANWPGDVGAVFNFMKTLDPSSTVREWEFALAAKSAWVWEQFKNIPANKLEGTILTEEQRKAFGRLAFEYVKNKGKSYDIKYNDYTRVLKNQWIPESYYPTKMTDMIWQYDGTSNPQKSDFLNQIKSISESLSKWLSWIK